MKSISKQSCLALQFMMMMMVVMAAMAWGFSPANTWPAPGALTPGVQAVQQFDSLGNTWVYLMYLPPEYANQPSRQWPFIIFLGTQGSCNEFSPFDRVYDDRSPAKYTNAGVGNYLRTPENCKYVSDSFIVIRPWYSTALGSCGTGTNYDAYFLPLLSHLKGSFHIDPSRLHLMGYCLGGGTAYKLATQHPDLFASVSLWSVNGSTACIDMSKLPLLDNIGLRLYHGTSDNVIPLASGQEFRDAINSRNAQRTAPFVWQEVAGPHETWHSFANCTDTVKALYDWMLARKTGTTGIANAKRDNVMNNELRIHLSRVISSGQTVTLQGQIVQSNGIIKQRGLYIREKIDENGFGKSVMMVK